MTTFSKKICTSCVVAVTLVAGALMLLPKGAHDGRAVAGPARQSIAEPTEPDQWKINPADPLAPDGVSWAPRTGDGSN